MPPIILDPCLTVARRRCQFMLQFGQRSSSEDQNVVAPQDHKFDKVKYFVICLWIVSSLRSPLDSGRQHSKTRALRVCLMSTGKENN